MTKYLESGGFNSPANNRNYENNYDRVFGPKEEDAVQLAECEATYDDYQGGLRAEAIGLESSIAEVEAELRDLLRKAATRAGHLAEYREALDEIRKMTGCPCCTL